MLAFGKSTIREGAYYLEPDGFLLLLVLFLLVLLLDGLSFVAALDRPIENPEKKRFGWVPRHHTVHRGR